MRILLVEDDIQVLKLIKRWLEDYGECDTAENGQEAIELFAESLENGEKYGLVVLDILMPRMSGRKALSRIRSMEREKGIAESEGAKVIVISAMSDPDNIIESYRQRCGAYLVKPVRKGDFERELSMLGISKKEGGE